jgi:hypothetical protein
MARQVAIGVLAVAAILAHPARAVADEAGSSVVFGAGVSEFGADGLREITGPAAMWEIRFTYGTERSIGLEAAYVGTAQSLDAARMGDDAAIVSNGAEANVRFNALTDAWQPYAIIGIGWRRYELMSMDDIFMTQEDQDDVLVLPIGVGVAYRIDGVVLDLRGSFRLTEGEDPIDGMSGPEAKGARRLDTVDLAAHVGWAF